MKIGDRVFVHGYIDEIRKDTVIIRNDGGYFGTAPSEVVTGELPSVQPEITDGQAIEHLQESGWMQSHDKQMYEMGLRERLADDSDSYDVLLPSAHPERPKGKWLSHYEYCKKHELLPSGLVAFRWCDQCEQGVEHPTNFCPHCGADMRGEVE